MLNENAKKLIDALRSGKYRQGRGQLKQIPINNSQVITHCCLGVACEIAKENGVEIEETIDKYGRAIFDGEKMYLSHIVREWLGFCDSRGRFKPIKTQSYEQAELAYLNDHGKTFDEIATLIESEPAGLFCTKQELEELRKQGE